MKLIYKKSIMLLFSLLSLVSLFGINTTGTSAAEKYTEQEKEMMKTMTQQEKTNYMQLKQMEPKTKLTEEQKIKFDKYVKLENNKYVIDNTTRGLSLKEFKILKEYIDYSNYVMKDFNFSNANVKIEDKSIKIDVPSKSRGYGWTYFYWIWYGFKAGLNQSDFSKVCWSGSVASAIAGGVASLLSLGTTAGVATVISGAIALYCIWGTGSGIEVYSQYGWTRAWYV